MIVGKYTDTLENNTLARVSDINEFKFNKGVGFNIEKFVPVSTQNTLKNIAKAIDSSRLNAVAKAIDSSGLNAAAKAIDSSGLNAAARTLSNYDNINCF